MVDIAGQMAVTLEQQALQTHVWETTWTHPQKECAGQQQRQQLHQHQQHPWAWVRRRCHGNNRKLSEGVEGAHRVPPVELHPMSPFLERKATDHMEMQPEEGEAGDSPGEVGLAEGEAGDSPREVGLAEGEAAGEKACNPVQPLVLEKPEAGCQKADLTRVLGLMAPIAKMVEVERVTEGSVTVRARTGRAMPMPTDPRIRCKHNISHTIPYHDVQCFNGIEAHFVLTAHLLVLWWLSGKSEQSMVRSLHRRPRLSAVRRQSRRTPELRSKSW